MQAQSPTEAFRVRGNADLSSSVDNMDGGSGNFLRRRAFVYVQTGDLFCYSNNSFISVYQQLHGESLALVAMRSCKPWKQYKPSKSYRCIK